MPNSLKWVLGILAVAIAGGLIAVNILRLTSPASAPTGGGRELVYVVPQGTISKVGQGQQKSILPDEMHLTLGDQDTLVIRNEDFYPIEVAGILIHPGQQYKQQFTKAGNFDLLCSVHGDTKIKIIVTDVAR